MSDSSPTPDYRKMAEALLKIAADLCRQASGSGNTEQQDLAARLKRIAFEMQGGKAPEPGSP